jgi:hypothetical protein
MHRPTIKNTVVDEQNGITYHVMAYRELSSEESRLAVKYFLTNRRERKAKKFKRGDVVEIILLLGA